MASHTGFGRVTKKTQDNKSAKRERVLSKMRPRLLLLLAVAAASKWPEPPESAVDAYVRSWAAGGI